VEGEAGIDCEDAVDGSYKGMTLCPPLDLVNGGFLPFPGIDSAANTDYYPLFIERSSQFARLKSVGTGTSLVLQEVDSAGKPTRYIKPKNDADGNGGVWVAGEYVAPIEYPTTVSILSPEQLAEKHLYGSGFEIKTEFHGVPVDLTVVTSNATLAQYKQTRGCMPNQEMAKYGASAEDRMAEIVLSGHYVGYLRYSGLNEAGYPFEHYLDDLQAGGDRSYTTWGVRPGQDDGEFRVDPRAPVEFVATNAKVDPDGNGRTTGFVGLEGNGFQQLEKGGLRAVFAIGTNFNDYLSFSPNLSGVFSSSFLYLGSIRESLQGELPLFFAEEYPTTVTRLNTIYYVNQIYEDSHHQIGAGILTP
jgi:hypothetical protein